jgi:hypothetical protein
MRTLLTLLTLLCASTLWAQQPLYVVNGRVVETLEGIQQSDIESIDVLPADEDTIAEWGLGASEGVIVVRLKFDTPATFSAEGVNNFTAYLAKHIKWNESMPAERVSLRLRITEDGTATIVEVLDSTSRQFLKRVTRTIASAPRWQPAMRDGKAIESLQLVNIQLPIGKELPRDPYVVIR